MADHILQDILEETRSNLAINNSRIVKLVKKLEEKGILSTEEATQMLGQLPLINP